MKKTNVKSRIRRDELNPLFHFKDKEEDDKLLTLNVMKQALKSGKLELSSKNLKFGKYKIVFVDVFKVSSKFLNSSSMTNSVLMTINRRLEARF